MSTTPATNGAPGGQQSTTFDTSNILQALEIIHNPSTKNDVRRQASDFLEQLKTSDDAPEYGYILSTDRSQPPLVRHFGLSLLNYIIRHQGHKFSEEQNDQIRNCILELGRSIEPSDLAF